MQWILVARDEELAGLTTVTLNRPEKLNAINLRMHAELQQVCLNLKRGADTRVVIFTGAGRAFSAGGDLSGRFSIADCTTRSSDAVTEVE